MKTPLSTESAGSSWDSINGGLNAALNAWGKVELIKAQKSASGQDQNQAKLQPELENGASVQFDVAARTEAKQSAFKINQPLMIGSVALLALALYMRR